MELCINSGQKLPKFGVVLFDDSEPIQKALKNWHTVLLGVVHLNVEEKKTRAAREGNHKDNSLGGSGSPSTPLWWAVWWDERPSQEGMVQKPAIDVRSKVPTQKQ